uniref:Uncharacterized protein n=1 Tax=Micrurus corallinus TaxID=54390 RepID=A0A2D4F4T8_MICCO
MRNEQLELWPKGYFTHNRKPVPCTSIYLKNNLRQTNSVDALQIYLPNSFSYCTCMGTALEDAHHTAEPNFYISMLEKDISCKPNTEFLQMSPTPADVTGWRKILLWLCLLR